MWKRSGGPWSGWAERVRKESTALATTSLLARSRTRLPNRYLSPFARSRLVWAALTSSFSRPLSDCGASHHRSLQQSDGLGRERMSAPRRTGTKGRLTTKLVVVAGRLIIGFFVGAFMTPSRGAPPPAPFSAVNYGDGKDAHHAEYPHSSRSHCGHGRSGFHASCVRARAWVGLRVPPASAKRTPLRLPGGRRTAPFSGERPRLLCKGRA